MRVPAPALASVLASVLASTLASTLAALAVVLLLAAPAGAALDFPALSGRVVDEAGILRPDAKARLEGELKGLEAKSSDQLVVVTLRSLRGTDIADYGYQLGRAWGIGQKSLNNGVLLIVAPNERKVRIEVGYGLEPILTDALTSVVIQSAILPKFKAGDMAGGIEAGVTALVSALTDDGSEWRRRAEAAKAGRSEEGGLSPDTLFMILFFVIFALIMIQSFRRDRAVGETRGRGGAWRRSGPVILPGPGWSGGGGFSGGGGGGGGSSGSW
jgi:uncharacterized protein